MGPGEPAALDAGPCGRRRWRPGLTYLLREYSVVFLALGVMRDARQELYVSLLGKSQTFHGRQRIGDIMARATDDVGMLVMMFLPGLTLIIDSVLAVMMPLVLIGQLDPRLLLVPLIFCRALGADRVGL